jgi:hypothetical protein
VIFSSNIIKNPQVLKRQSRKKKVLKKEKEKKEKGKEEEKEKHQESLQIKGKSIF